MTHISVRAALLLSESRDRVRGGVMMRGEGSGEVRGEVGGEEVG